MATFNATEYAAIYATLPNVKQKTTLYGARVHYREANVPAIVGLAQNDLVNLFTLPKGARPLMYALTFGAYGSSVTLDIGWSGDEDALESALDISSAGAVAWKAVDDDSLLTAEKTVQAKFEGGNPDDTKTLRVQLLYILPND